MTISHLNFLFDYFSLDHFQTGRDIVSGNRWAIERFHYVTKRLVFKWLNRRSQKASFTWEGFEEYLKHYPLPEPRIVHHLYTLSFDS